MKQRETVNLDISASPRVAAVLKQSQCSVTVSSRAADERGEGGLDEDK